MKSKRKSGLSALLILCVIGCMVLSACSAKEGNNKNEPAPTPSPSNAESNGEQEPPVTVDEDKEPVTLKLLTWNVDSYKEEFEMFHQRYPWITIEPILVTGGESLLIEKAIAMQAAGDPADLTFLSDMSGWVRNGYLEDLTPFIAKDETIQNSNVIDGFVEAFKVQDKLYAMPFKIVSMYFAVNKNMLEKNGLDMPANDWTYDEFLELAKKATDPAANEYGVSYDATMARFLNWVYPVANGSAANLYALNEDLTQSLANTPEVMADYTWLQELMTKWHVRPSSEEANALGWETENNFAKGKELFTMIGDWHLPILNQVTDFEWDILPFPTGKAKQAALQILAPMGMLSASKHKEEAFLWFSFQFELETQKRMINNGATSFVISQELDDYVDQAEVWKGKNVSAVKHTKTLCCYLPGPTIPDFDWYMNNVDGALPGLMWNGGDLTGVGLNAEEWNTITAETRKLLGW